MMHQGCDAAETGGRASRQTAYAADAQPLPGAGAVRSGWAEGIDRLLAGGHRFLDLCYAPGGALFRGMSRGLAEALAAGRFGHFDDPAALSALERELGVVLCSQDLADALAVARPWENPAGVVLVFPSEVFQAEWEARRAAVLGFAEPGVVFRYPFLLRPLAPAELVALVLAPGTAAPSGLDLPVVSLPASLAGDRRATEAAARTALEARGLAPARLRGGVEHPRRAVRAQPGVVESPARAPGGADGQAGLA